MKDTARCGSLSGVEIDMTRAAAVAVAKLDGYFLLRA